MLYLLNPTLPTFLFRRPVKYIFRWNNEWALDFSVPVRKLNSHGHLGFKKHSNAGYDDVTPLAHPLLHIMESVSLPCSPLVSPNPAFLVNWKKYCTTLKAFLWDESRTESFKFRFPKSVEHVLQHRVCCLWNKQPWVEEGAGLGYKILVFVKSQE